MRVSSICTTRDSHEGFAILPHEVDVAFQHTLEATAVVELDGMVHTQSFRRVGKFCFDDWQHVDYCLHMGLLASLYEKVLTSITTQGVLASSLCHASQAEPEIS